MNREWIVEQRPDGLYAALKINHADGRIVQQPFSLATETIVRGYLADVTGSIAAKMVERDAALAAANAQLASLRTEEEDLRNLLDRVVDPVVPALPIP